MLAVVLRRLATGACTLLLVTALVFALVHVSAAGPLDPDTAGEGLHALPRAAVEELRAFYRLDRPLPERYALWLADVARGDLGLSFQDRRPVATRIAERLGTTLTLNALALVLMAGCALPLGALAALRPGSVWDRWVASGTYALQAIPVFWAGLLLQRFLSVDLGLLPLAGLTADGAHEWGVAARLADRAAHLVLPVLCLAYGGVAYLSRFVRANLLEHLGDEALRAARARGLSVGAVLVRHGFRRAALPLLTLAGFVLPGLVGGSVLVEQVFALPGLGSLFVEAASGRDLPLLLGLTLLSGVATLAGILLADVTYAWADPRVRRG